MLEDGNSQPEEQKVQKKASPESETPDQRRHFICPVCGTPIHHMNLPDLQSVVEERIYFASEMLIANSSVEFHCDFEHYCDEEGLPMENPHTVYGVIKTVFDSAGRCVKFDVVEVRSSLPGRR
ncbi:MAG: hypothetical protein HXS46_00230 [Theionarchaea archaeon]|nr:hypothetical protein [Theionarchaea archaeon]